jgi:hypothetical protein
MGIAMQHRVIKSLIVAITLAGCGADTVPASAPPQGVPVVGGSGSVLPAAGGGTGPIVSNPLPVQGQAGFGAGSSVAIPPAAGSGAPLAGRAGLPPVATAGAPAAGSGVLPIAGAGAAPAAGTGSPVPTATGGTDPVIPKVNGECPKIVSGGVNILGGAILLTVGAKSTTQKGPIVIFWHGTGGSAATAGLELGANVVSEVTASGGVIASMESGGKGNPIDWGVFTTGDFEIVDQIVACSVAQLNIDTRRIYTSGASAGGLAAGTLAIMRSSYMAGTYPNSGGIAPWPGLAVLQDPAHVPVAFTMHGAMGVDMVVIDFGTSSMDEDKFLVSKGGFAVDCNHGGGHVGAPADLKAAGWEFMKAHPFGTKPSPYAGGLPASYPKYCMIVK